MVLVWLNIAIWVGEKKEKILKLFMVYQVANIEWNVEN